MEDAFAPLLLGLDRLPAHTHRAAAVRLGVTEDVWMPAHELGVDSPGYGFEVSLALLLEEQGQEVDLEEEVTELVEQLAG